MDTRLLACLEDRVLRRQKAFDDDVVDTTPEKVHINVNLFKMLAERR